MSNLALPPTLTDEQVKQVQEVRELAAKQEQQFKLHPAAGFVEIEIRESRLEISPRRVFVPFATWEAIFGTLLHMRLAAAGVTSQLTQDAPRKG